MNPPNCPTLRPIEQYWAILKNKLRKQGRNHRNIEELSDTWEETVASVPKRTVQTLMSGIKRKTRNFIRNE